LHRMIPAQGTALAIDVFGRRMHHDVGAEFHRPLQDRRGKGVIHDDARARFMGDIGHAFDVDDFQRRIRGRLKKDEFGLRPHRRPPGGEIGAVDNGVRDTEAREDILDHITYGAKTEPEPPPRDRLP